MLQRVSEREHVDNPLAQRKDLARPAQAERERQPGRTWNSGSQEPSDKSVVLKQLSIFCPEAARGVRVSLQWKPASTAETPSPEAALTFLHSLLGSLGRITNPTKKFGLYFGAVEAWLAGLLACWLACLFLKIALAILELTVQTRLASNSQRSRCLCFPSAGLKGMQPHTHLEGFLFLRVNQEI